MVGLIVANSSLAAGQSQSHSVHLIPPTMLAAAPQHDMAGSHYGHAGPSPPLDHDSLPAASQCVHCKDLFSKSFGRFYLGFTFTQSVPV